MTQFFNSSSSHSPSQNEKKTSGIGFGNTPTKTNSGPHFPQKWKNFFRMNSNNNSLSFDSNGAGVNNGSSSSGGSGHHSFRQSRFLRGRSPSLASPGVRIDNADIASPTANANPYFAHQGPPVIQHQEYLDQPLSPPHTPTGHGVASAATGANDQAANAGKEELARKLRRVASAPNAQGMLGGSGTQDGRPTTAESGMGLLSPSAANSHSAIDPETELSVSTTELGVPSPPFLGDAPRGKGGHAFRRTYSSNSIKVRDVEVNPGSFEKIKLLGKGDVGKVYLVREKKSSRLYAMKGNMTYSQPFVMIC